MPVRYTIDKERRLILSTMSGVLTAEDIWGHQKALAKDPDFDGSLSQISDFTQVTKMELTEQDVQKFAEASVFDHDARRAIIVKDRFSFGLARMFEVLRESKGEEGLRIFRNLDEALDWVVATNDA